MKRCRALANDEAETARIAGELAGTIAAGNTIALSGPLGAGKTAFVRAFVAALHGMETVHSPTFSIRHRYPGEPAVEHLDFYRLSDYREVAELGLEDAFGAGVITLVEWPELCPELIPANAVRVRIEGAGGAPRTVTIDRP